MTSATYTPALPKWAEAMQPVDMAGCAGTLNITCDRLEELLTVYPNLYERRWRRKIFYPEHVNALAEVVRTKSDEAKRGSIYFVECQGYIKIGFSTNWRRRMFHIQGSTPLPIIVLAVTEGTRLDERILQVRFRKQHHRLEWFHHRGPLKRYIEDLLK